MNAEGPVKGRMIPMRNEFSGWLGRNTSTINTVTTKMVTAARAIRSFFMDGPSDLQTGRLGDNSTPSRFAPGRGFGAPQRCPNPHRIHDHFVKSINVEEIVHGIVVEVNDWADRDIEGSSGQTCVLGCMTRIEKKVAQRSFAVLPIQPRQYSRDEDNAGSIPEP